jgi:hypothetical protein
MSENIFHGSEIKIGRACQVVLTPGETGRLTVGRKITLTLTLMTGWKTS